MRSVARYLGRYQMHSPQMPSYSYPFQSYIVSEIAYALFQTTEALPGFIFHSENATTYKTIKFTSGIIISSESAPANPALEKIFQYGITNGLTPFSVRIGV